MSKNLLIVIGLGVAAALAVYFVLQGGFSFTPSPSEEPYQPIPIRQPEPTPPPESTPEPLEGQGQVEPQEFTITGTEFAFSPSKITVKAGQPVRITFVNGGRAPHNFAIPELGLSTRTIGPGAREVLEFVIEERGVYSLQSVCTVPGHKEAGMVGELRVE